jgi:hypothetical protein
LFRRDRDMQGIAGSPGLSKGFPGLGARAFSLA